MISTTAGSQSSSLADSFDADVSNSTSVVVSVARDSREQDRSAEVVSANVGFARIFRCRAGDRFSSAGSVGALVVESTQVVVRAEEVGIRNGTVRAVSSERIASWR